MALAVVLLVTTLVCGVFAPILARPSGVLAVTCFVAALAVSVWSGAQGGNSRRYHAERTSYSHGPSVDWNALVCAGPALVWSLSTLAAGPGAHRRRGPRMRTLVRWVPHDA